MDALSEQEEVEEEKQEVTWSEPTVVGDRKFKNWVTGRRIYEKVRKER
jgi:hypothetical protein